MRTTLTIDDNLYRLLRNLSGQEGKTFRQTVNDALRRGLTGNLPAEEPEPFVVEPRHCGFHPGVDIGRLNQLSDDIELEGLGQSM